MDSCDEEAPLVVVVDDDELKKKGSSVTVDHRRDVHILSSAFLLVFLAYGAAQNLETTVNDAGNLGTISLGILYLSFMFFSLVASPVVRSLGSKNALVLGTSGYWLFIASNLIPSWYTMIPASLYMGFSASIIWVGQGTYLTATARSHAVENNLHEGTVIGDFNGEFWGMFASHQLIGNLISLALLKDGMVGYAIFMLSLVISSPGGSTSGTTLLFIVFLCSMTLGTILMCFLQKKTGKPEQDIPAASVSFCATVASLSKSVITPLLDIRMILVIPLIAYSGLQQAFVWAEFTKYIVTPSLGVSGVGGAMAVYGAFDAISSVAAGRLTSGLRSVTWILFVGMLAQTIVFLWLLLKYSAVSGIIGIVYPLLMAALLGAGDGVLMTQLNALIGMLFKHDTEGAFAQLKVWQSASIAVVFFIGPYITLKTMLLIMVAALLISVVSFMYLAVCVTKAFSSATI